MSRGKVCFWLANCVPRGPCPWPTPEISHIELSRRAGRAGRLPYPEPAHVAAVHVDEGLALFFTDDAERAA